jgi:hypothetical protein
MVSRNVHPKWWQLYLTFPLLIALFVIDARFRISARGHQVVQIGIVVLIYGLIHLWLKANAMALSNMDQKHDHGRTSIIRVPVTQLPNEDEEKRPLLELPASEIKSLLDKTYDIEYIDADQPDGRVDGVLPSYRDHKVSGKQN